ncbi:MAG: substrate-binding domain-containing protein [Rhodobacteraceae bacterium]|nr:substrate-binding domain-containing protein [Paracoccaceae bacterium]
MTHSSTAYGFLGAAILSAIFIPGTAFAHSLDDEYISSLGTSENWELPADGPAAAPEKSVVFVAASLRNSGILGVVEGVVEASEAIGWGLTVTDARGSAEMIAAALDEALAAPPDGLVVGGFDAASYADRLRRLATAGTEIVGWHAGPQPGPILDASVFFNVSTDPRGVACVATMHAIAQAGQSFGAVIFTDDRFGIALEKSNAMRDLVDACDTCTLLEVVNVRLDETATRMPAVVEELLQKHGDAWTVSLGINDLYFDDAVVAFSLGGIAPSGQIMNISAGDGSLTAYRRIRLANYQAATVPEPLNFQGWQLIDELNRAISDEEPSGFVAPTKLVIKANVDEEGGQKNLFDPDNGYRDRYRQTWLSTD